jgi:hypothetical protein
MALCIRCGNQPRKPGQRYGRACHALYMREWRSRYSGLERVIRRFVRDQISRETSETPFGRLALREQAAREVC